MYIHVYHASLHIRLAFFVENFLLINFHSLSLKRACVMICRSGSWLWINGKPNAFFIEHSTAFRCSVFRFFRTLVKIYVTRHLPCAECRVPSSLNYLAIAPVMRPFRCAPNIFETRLLFPTSLFSWFRKTCLTPHDTSSH